MRDDKLHNGSEASNGKTNNCSFVPFRYNASAFFTSINPQPSDSEESVMVGTCANPACSARFRTLCSGKLFLVETPTDVDASAGKLPVFAPVPHRIQYFWLCKVCAETMRVVYDKKRGVRVEPLPAIRDEPDIETVDDAARKEAA
jgi:hypothetical protein